MILRITAVNSLWGFSPCFPPYFLHGFGLSLALAFELLNLQIQCNFPCRPQTQTCAFRRFSQPLFHWGVTWCDHSHLKELFFSNKGNLLFLRWQVSHLLQCLFIHSGRVTLLQGPADPRDHTSCVPPRLVVSAYASMHLATFLRNAPSAFSLTRASFIIYTNQRVKHNESNSSSSARRPN